MDYGANLLFQHIERYSGVSGKRLRLGVIGVNEFDRDSVDLIFKLFGPIEIFTICFYKQYFSLKNTNIIYSLGVVIGQIDNLMIEIFVVLVSLNYTDILVDGLLQVLYSFFLDYLLKFEHIRNLIDWDSKCDKIYLCSFIFFY